jgi:hypothetical protein
LEQAVANDLLPPMDTPAPDWMPDASKHNYPGWVQRKAVTLSKREITAPTNRNRTL